MAEVAASRKDNIGNTQGLLHVCGESCGACMLLQVSNPESHKPGSCPMLSAEERRESGTMRGNLVYRRPYNGACWKCHLPSGGDDQWHPGFGSKAPCPHPNLVWSMVYVIWKRKLYAQEARAALNITDSWNTSADFEQWFTKGVWSNSKQEPNGYRLVKWIVQSQLKLTA
jgi:hypothetical protein